MKNKNFAKWVLWLCLSMLLISFVSGIQQSGGTAASTNPSNLCAKNNYPIDYLGGNDAVYAYGCIDATHATACEKSSGKITQTSFEVPSGHVLTSICSAYPPQSVYTAAGTSTSGTPGTTPTAPFACLSPYQCQEIDEVWQVISGSALLGISAEKQGKYWEPQLKVWKPFVVATAGGGAKQPITTNCRQQAFSDTEAEANSKLVSISFQGKSIAVNYMIAPLVKKIDQDLSKLGLSYKFNSVGTFSWRCVKSPTVEIIDKVTCEDSEGEVRQSKHSYGIAIDINPKTNPFCVTGPGGVMYTSKSMQKECPKYGNKYYDLPDAVVQVFKNNGFEWGGDWETGKDYMHFQWKGDIGDFNKDGTLEQCGGSSGAKVSTLSSEQKEWVKTYATAEGVNPQLALAIINAESTGDSNAISDTGCSGLMQICAKSASPTIIKVQCEQDDSLGPQQCDLNTCQTQSSGWIWCETCAKTKGNNCAPDDRFDAEKNIRSGVIAFKKKQNSVTGCQAGADLVKCQVAAYNAGQAIVNGAIKKTGKAAPTWEEVYAQYDIQLFRDNNYDSSFSDKKIQSKIDHTPGYVNQIYNAYAGGIE